MWVDSLAQTYHWSYGEILKLSMAQVVMLTHAGNVNSQRLNVKMKTVRGEPDEPSNAPAESSDDLMFEGKRLEDLNSDEYMRYFNS